jgi:hypothetical protein
MKIWILILVSVFAFQASSGELQKVRWTGKDKSLSDLTAILSQLSQQLQISLKAEDFRLNEKRDLQGMNFSYYQQMVDGVPVRNAGVRIWQNPQTQNLIQMIAYIFNPTTKEMKLARTQYQRTLLESSLSDISFANVRKIVGEDLTQIRNFKAVRQWKDDKVILMLTVFGKDRSVEYHLDPRTLVIQYRQVRMYPQTETKAPRINQTDEYSVPAHVFKVNEEVEMPWGRRASGAKPEPVELKYLKKKNRATLQDWTAQMPQREFNSAKEDPIKAATPEGRAEGYWSAQSIKEMIDATTQMIPERANQAASAAYLDGRYVQILINSEAFKKFNVQTFSPFYSTAVSQSWAPAASGWNLNLNAASFGRAFFSPADLLLRQAPYETRRDTGALINEGFDEMQVYWAVTKWFETMQDAGFNDFELSTRPIQAFLFDPDIESQNNAFYNQDTINFTTYTDDSINEARNLITIWHELGHGLMDRLQGSSGFDNGGLSEGIADFAAEMVLRGYYKNQVPEAIARRRIVNRTGFQLTSEFHDDGEAYGGSLKDVMDLKIAQDGFVGYAKTCDLVLDAMRLTRQSPNLSLQDWYEALVLSDENGKTGLRAPGEFAATLKTAFAGRNYVYLQPAAAKMTLSYNDIEITDSSKGSRSSPIKLALAAGSEQDFLLKLNVKSAADVYAYPLKVVLSYKETNALQGAAKYKDEADQAFTLNSPNDTIEIPITVLAGCDSINTSQNSCKDFVNVQVFAKDAAESFAKKRFYIDNKNITN